MESPKTRKKSKKRTAKKCEMRFIKVINDDTFKLHAINTSQKNPSLNFFNQKNAIN